MARRAKRGGAAVMAVTRRRATGRGAAVPVAARTDDALYTDWTRRRSAAAGQQLQLRLAPRIPRWVGWWLYRAARENRLDYRARVAEAAAAVLVGTIERLRRGTYRRGRGRTVMTYARAVARNCFLDWVEQERPWGRRLTLVPGEVETDREQPAAAGEVGEEELAADPACSPATDLPVMTRQAAVALAAAFRGEPAWLRETFVLRVQEGLSLAEAAARVGTNKVRVFRRTQAVLDRLPQAVRDFIVGELLSDRPALFIAAVDGLAR